MSRDNAQEARRQRRQAHEQEATTPTAQAASQPANEYPPLEPEPTTPQAPAQYHVIQTGGPSAWTIAAGIVMGVLILALIPWIIAGGCLSCLALSVPTDLDIPEPTVDTSPPRIPSARPSHASTPVPSPVPSLTPNLRVRDWLWRSRPDFASGALEYLGEIANDGQKTARFVKVNVAFYDASGHILTTDWTYCRPHEISPGGSSTFKGWADYYADAETCRLSLSYK